MLINEKGTASLQFPFLYYVYNVAVRVDLIFKSDVHTANLTAYGFGKFIDKLHNVCIWWIAEVRPRLCRLSITIHLEVCLMTRKMRRMYRYESMVARNLTVCMA